jgi:hypothetical protein
MLVPFRSNKREEAFSALAEVWPHGGFEAGIQVPKLRKEQDSL